MSNRARAQQAARAAWERKQRQQRQQRRRRAAWVSALAVAVLLLAGLAGAVAWQANQPGEVTTPTAATASEGLPAGSGPVTVEVYLDFLCPACAAFDQAARPTLDGYLADGTVTVVYHPISILDRNTTTAYSTRAAAAAGCAADAGQLDEFVAVLMANQPVGIPAGLSGDEIVALGASAGLTDASFGQCVRDGTYRNWVARSTDVAFDRGVTGTPTVFVAGARLDTLSAAELVAAIDQATTG